MLPCCQHCAAISPLATIASMRRPSRAQSRNLVRCRHRALSRASLMAMARLLAAAERPLPGSRRCASTPPHLDSAASPACWWQGPTPVSYRAKGLELVACERRSRGDLRPVAPTPWSGAAAPRPRRQIPVTTAPHVVAWELAAPRASLQHELAVVPVRRGSSPVTAILARSGGAASRGWGTEIGGGGAGDEAMGMSVGPRSFVTARVDDITGCRPEPIHIGRTRSFDHPI